MQIVQGRCNREGGRHAGGRLGPGRGCIPRHATFLRLVDGLQVGGLEPVANDVAFVQPEKFLPGAIDCLGAIFSGMPASAATAKIRSGSNALLGAVFGMKRKPRPLKRLGY